MFVESMLRARRVRERSHQVHLVAEFAEDVAHFELHLNVAHFRVQLRVDFDCVRLVAVGVHVDVAKVEL